MTAAVTAAPNETPRSDRPALREVNDRAKTARRLLGSSSRNSYLPDLDIDWDAPEVPGLYHVQPERMTLFGTALWESLTEEQRIELSKHEVISVAREAFKKRGIKLEEVTANSTGEVFQAAQVLTHRNVQALWVTGDNTALQSFDGIVKAARDAKLPLIINDPEFTQRGAVASVGLGWSEAGQAAGKLVARALRGESPQNIQIGRAHV